MHAEEPNETANEGAAVVGTGSGTEAGDTLTYSWQLISSTQWAIAVGRQ